MPRIDQEQHPSDDDEVNHEGNKIPQAKTAPCFFASANVVGSDLRRQRDEVIGEIEAAGDRADERHDDVADQRVDDGAEGRADDHADGEIDDIAAQREFLEVVEHGRPALPRTA